MKLEPKYKFKQLISLPDSTHLAEFHQIEGLIADYDLTLADLIGVITQFFQKWGMCSERTFSCTMMLKQRSIRHDRTPLQTRVQPLH